MKDIKNPFAQSAASSMDAALTRYELEHRHYKDLLMIRDKIQKGQLTPELYDFINMDGTMEKLFPGLPKPSSVACEGLSTIQLEMINASIAEEENKIKSILMWLWEAMKNWFLDWWDRCRYEKRCLEYIKAKYNISSNIFGTRDNFSSIVVCSYSKQEWLTMTDACASLINYCKNIVTASGDKLKDEVMKIKVTASVPLDVFGKYITEDSIIKQGTPKYTKISRTCVNGGWRYEEIGTYLERAIAILGSDIDIRKELNMLESKFKNGNADDKDSFEFLKRFVYASKEANLHTARSLRLMLNSIRNKVATPDYKLHHL